VVSAVAALAAAPASLLVAAASNLPEVVPQEDAAAVAPASRLWHRLPSQHFDATAGRAAGLVHLRQRGVRVFNKTDET
jgi:hypothetical protein